MTRILLIDDHPVVRYGIRQILIESFGAVALTEAEDGSSGLDQALKGEWDVVLLDITLPGIDGLDVLKALRRSRPALPVLVLSMHPASQFEQRVLSAGAAGYVTKSAAAKELAEAIEQVRRGRRYASAASLGALARPRRNLPPHEMLSDREYQVFRMLGSGLTVSAVAGSLGLSVKTISTYRTRILEKLGMRTNAEIMRYAIENNLLNS